MGNFPDAVRGFKNMNKIVLLLMASLICFAFPIINAQELIDVEVVEGFVLEADAYTSKNLSASIGGLITSFEKRISEILEFAGINVYKNDSVVPTDFELFAFPIGSNPDFDLISNISVFAESESIILQDRTLTPNVWVTNNVYGSSGEGMDSQELVGLNQPLVSNCSEVIVTSISDTDVFYEVDSIPNGDAIPIPCDSNCPTQIEMSLFGFDYGVHYDSLSYFIPKEFPNSTILILKLEGSLVGFLTDKNCDNVWDFAINIFEGKSVLSHEGNTLLLSEPGYFDIYIVV